jgi:RNA polymerase sigma-70 factor (ECF subfamily)
MSRSSQTETITSFLTGLSPKQRELLLGREPEACELLERLGDEARMSHPGVVFPLPVLAQALAARLAGGQDPIAELRVIHAADVFLAGACAAGDREAVRCLDAMLRIEVETAAADMRARASLAEEVIDRLRMHLFVGDGKRPPAVLDFAGRGNLKGFLKVTAVREILRLRRHEQRETSLEAEDLSLLVPAVDPVLEKLKQTYRQQFSACFVEALADLSARERTLLCYNVLDRLSIDQIGALYRVHRATAARWLDRIRSRLAKDTEERLGQVLAISGTEVASIIRLVRSQLNVSLQRILSQEREPARVT